METAAQIKKLLSEINSEYADSASGLLTSFATHLLQANQKFNLVSRTNTPALIQSLILDSLTLMTVVKYEPNIRLLDIGSGAGFPGLVQKIVRPDLTLVSVDSNKKKIEFQRSVASLLSLDKCQFKADRIESVTLEPADYAVAKGLASIGQICRWSRPHLKGGGILILPRGLDEPFTPELIADGFTLLRREEYSAGHGGRSAVVLLSRIAEPHSPWVISQDN